MAAPAPEAAGRRHDPPDKRKAAAPDGDRRNGSQNNVKGISPSHDGAHAVNGDLPLIDKLGIRHRTVIQRAWSATALRALDVRWAATGQPAYEVGEARHD